MIYTVMKHLLIILILPFLNGCITDMHGRTLLGSIGTGVKESFDPTKPRGFSNYQERRNMAYRDGVQLPKGMRYKSDPKYLYHQWIANKEPHFNDVRTTRYANGVTVRTWSSFSAGRDDYWKTLSIWDMRENRFRPYRSRHEYLNGLK